MKSPYKHLLSANKNKPPTESTRKIYLNELPFKKYTHNKSLESEEYRKYHSSSRNIIKKIPLNLNTHIHHSHEKELFSDRKSIDYKKSSLLRTENTTGRHSKMIKNKLYSTNSRMDRGNV